MNDSARTGRDQDAANAVAVADSDPADGSIFDAIEAEAVEEQHLDERHATGEHYIGPQEHCAGA